MEMPAGAEVTVEMPGVESEIAGETIQAVGKKGWRTYQPSFLRRKRKLGFMKCAAALSPALLYLGPLVCPRPPRRTPHHAPTPVWRRRNSYKAGKNILARRRKKGRWQLSVT